jgi:hypothetical protein
MWMRRQGSEFPIEPLAQQGQSKAKTPPEASALLVPSHKKRRGRSLVIPSPKMPGPSVQNVDDIDFSDIEAKCVYLASNLDRFPDELNLSNIADTEWTSTMA